MAGTTQVLNDSLVKTVERVAQTDVPTGLLSATRVGYDQMDVRDFLAKPVILGITTWSTQSSGDVLVNMSLPQDAFSSPVYSGKLEGFLGFRGTAVVRLQVNGNRFQAGRLLLCFIPQGNVTNSFPGMRLRSLKAATQLPRVELDLASDTEVVMEIPYVSPTPFYNLVDQTGPIGRAAVVVYSPLATGSGSSEVNVSMWISFKDVELVAPIAQMATRQPTGKKGLSVSEQELEIYGDKPISGGLRQMSKAAETFARVPVLSTFAKPASWLLSALSGSAAAFGYSKPTTEEAVTKVITVSNFHTQNHNGVDMFPNMGLDASNSLSALPGFAGTDLDEMSLNHLTQIPAFGTAFNWSTITSAGTTLLSAQVSPYVFTQSAVHSSWPTYDYSPVGFFSRFFFYWRGSIVFTLKIVKTTFHSGRLLVCYNPSGVSPDISSSSFLLREIVDVRETSEFRFVVPYTATTQYKRCGTEDGTGVENVGLFSVICLNELVAPSTVSSSVQVLVEVSAGPDFELACPRPFTLRPITLPGWAAQMNVPSENPSSRDDRNQEMVAVGSASIPSQDLIASQYCIGEKVNSILQLLKRYALVRSTLLSGAPTNAWIWRPFTLGATNTLSPPSLNAVPSSDYIAAMSLCFAYSRGSLRVMAAVSNDYDSAGHKIVWAFPSADSTILQDSISLLEDGIGIPRNYQVSSQPVWGATLPPYQPLHARLNRISDSSITEPVDIYTSPMKLGVTTGSSAGDAVVRLSRAAGDDFSLGYFIGTPLMTIYA